METLFSAEFWSNQLDFALKAWAIIIPLFILIFWAGFRSKSAAQSHRIRAHEEPLDARLELAREQNADEAKTVANIRTEIAELRKLIGTGAKPSVLQHINELKINSQCAGDGQQRDGSYTHRTKSCNRSLKGFAKAVVETLLRIMHLLASAIIFVSLDAKHSNFCRI